MGLFCRIVFSGPACPLFHVKHLCVKGLSSQAARDVSRETIFSSAAHERPARVDVSRETFLRKSECLGSQSWSPGDAHILRPDARRLNRVPSPLVGEGQGEG